MMMVTVPQLPSKQRLVLRDLPRVVHFHVVFIFLAAQFFVVRVKR